MSEHDEWMAKHKGEYLRTVGEVWDCRDEECGCTQAQVTDVFRNKVTGTSLVFVGIWAGEFHTDHEPGAGAELAAYRRELRKSDPEREATIRWQEGVDYGLDEPS